MNDQMKLSSKKHSIRAYAERLSTKELLHLLRTCTENIEESKNTPCLEIVLDVLEQRYR